MKSIFLLLSIVLMMSSCASILNSKYQPVTIPAKQGDAVLINGETPAKKRERYLLRRDFTPKQVTISHDGHIDDNRVIMQYKKSPLHIMSWIPFAALIFFPPIYDIGPKAYDYDKALTIPQGTPSIAQKKEGFKEIRVNKLSVDLDPEDVKHRFFPTYRNYARKSHKRSAESSEGAKR